MTTPDTTKIILDGKLYAKQMHLGIEILVPATPVAFHETHYVLFGVYEDMWGSVYMFTRTAKDALSFVKIGRRRGRAPVGPRFYGHAPYDQFDLVQHGTYLGLPKQLYSHDEAPQFVGMSLRDVVLDLDL